MRALAINQSVKYVGTDGKIVDATILEPIGPTIARLEVGKDAHAIAEFNEDKKTANTFHFADDDTDAAASGKAKSKPFRPGAAPANGTKEPAA